MGFHQLITIVLSTVVTAVGLTMGISMFEADANKFERDAANVAMLDVASRAVAWSNKPQMMGGGMDAYGSASFSEATMEKLGYEHAGISDGALILPDGSCISGKPAGGGKSFHIEWHPMGDCHDPEQVALRLELNGPALDHISMVENDQGGTWQDG